MKQYCPHCKTDFIFKTNKINIFCPNCGCGIKNSHIKICQLCGSEFVSKNTKALYCNRIAREYENGETRTCKEIGPMNNYVKRLQEEDNVLLMLYRKYYRKMHARQIAKTVEKHIDNQQFKDWSKEAKIKLKQTQNGEITQEDFLKWLKEA